MHARAGRVADRLAGAVDVKLTGAREAGHDRVLDSACDLRDGGEVALGGYREAGLDDVDAHGVQELGDLDLLLEGHGGAGALLTVAQGGVEDEDAIPVAAGRYAWTGGLGAGRLGMVGHGVCSLDMSRARTSRH